MYCGDETGSFIGEIGSHTARFGYGGQDAPSYTVNSVVIEYEDERQTPKQKQKKQYSPTSCYRAPPPSTAASVKFPIRMVESPDPQQPVTDPVQFLQQGDSIQDWDAYEYLWNDAINALHVKDTSKHANNSTTKNATTATTTTTTAASGVQSSILRAEKAASESKVTHPILVVAPGCTHAVDGSTATAQKELLHLTEFMMETVQAGALFVAPAPQLAAFAHGRQTCLLVDIGAGGCRVTPIVDGLVLRTAQRRSGRGGDWLDHCQWRALAEERLGVLRPRYQLSRSYVTATTATGSSSSTTQQQQQWLVSPLGHAGFDVRASQC